MVRLSVVMLCCAVLAGCAGAPEALEKTGTFLRDAAPILPEPFNWILAGTGILAALIGGHFANKSRVATVAAGGTLGSVSPVVKMFAERKYLLPLLGVGVVAAETSGLLPFTTQELIGILTMLGIPTVAEFGKDILAVTKAGVVTPESPKV